MNEEEEREAAWRDLEFRKLNLKVQAMAERIAELEDKNADLRVEITIANEEFEKVHSELFDKVTEYEDKVMMCENNHGGPPADEPVGLPIEIGVAQA